MADSPDSITLPEIETAGPSRKSSRRSILAGMAGAAMLPTAAMAGTVAPAAAASPDLYRLIEDHRTAYRALEEAIDREQAFETAYDDVYSDPVIVPSLLGGGLGMSNGHEVCKKQIAAGYETQRERLTQLARVAPDLAEQVRAVMDAKEAENMTLVDRVFAEEEARREAFGWAAAKRDSEAASDAEIAAAMAICAYPCGTIEEARIRAEYLATAPIFSDGLQPDQVEALLLSFAESA